MGKAARKLSGAALSEWRAKHPFDPATGRFISGGGASAPSAPAAPGRARARLGLAPDTATPTAAPARTAKAARVEGAFGSSVTKSLFGDAPSPLAKQNRELVPLTAEELGHKPKPGDPDYRAPSPEPTRAERARRKLAAFEGQKVLFGGGASSTPEPAPAKAGRARAALGRPAPTPLDSRYHADLKRQVMDLVSESDGTSRAEALLSGLSVPALKEFAATLGPEAKLPSKIAKGEAIRRIVDGTIGYRQRAAAIGPNVAAERAAERVQPPSPSDPVSNRPRAARAKLAKPAARPEGERTRDLMAISGGVNPWADRLASGGQPAAVPAAPPKAGRARKALPDKPKEAVPGLERLMGGRPQPGEFGGNGPVARRVSANPRKRNTWGGAPQSNGVHYHPDGLMGETVGRLGPDAQVEVRGDSLANELDRIATATVLGHMTAQHQADDLKRLASELPDGPGKRAVQSAANDLDAPRIDIDRWASGVEPVLARFPVLRQLAQRLESIPLARGADIPGDRADTRELDALHKALAQFNEGSLGGGRFISAIEALGNKRHESREGKLELDRAVRDAVDQLQSMQRADRTLFYPPGKA